MRTQEGMAQPVAFLVAVIMPASDSIASVWPDGKADQFPETPETPLEPPL